MSTSFLHTVRTSKKRRLFVTILKNDGFHADFLPFGGFRDKAASDRYTVHAEFHVRPGPVVWIPHFDVLKRSGKSPVQSVFVPFGGDARGDPDPANSAKRFPANRKKFADRFESLLPGLKG